MPIFFIVAISFIAGGGIANMDTAHVKQKKLATEYCLGVQSVYSKNGIYKISMDECINVYISERNIL